MLKILLKFGILDNDDSDLTKMLAVICSYLWVILLILFLFSLVNELLLENRFNNFLDFIGKIWKLVYFLSLSALIVNLFFNSGENKEK